MQATAKYWLPSQLINANLDFAVCSIQSRLFKHLVKGATSLHGHLPLQSTRLGLSARDLYYDAFIGLATTMTSEMAATL